MNAPCILVEWIQEKNDEFQGSDERAKRWLRTIVPAVQWLAGNSWVDESLSVMCYLQQQEPFNWFLKNMLFFHRN